MRTKDQVQRAHDLLVGIIVGEVPPEVVGLTADDLKKLCWLAGVLCWVLEHEHNKAFGELLEDVENGLAQGGYFFGNEVRLE